MAPLNLTARPPLHPDLGRKQPLPVSSALAKTCPLSPPSPQFSASAAEGSWGEGWGEPAGPLLKSVIKSEPAAGLSLEGGFLTLLLSSVAQASQSHSTFHSRCFSKIPILDGAFS